MTAFKAQDSRAPPLHTQVVTWTPPSSDADAARVPQIPTAGLSGSMAVLQGAPSTAVSGSSAAAAAAAGGAGGAAGGGVSGGEAQGSVGWQRGVIEKIVAVLYEYRVELAAAFSMFDSDRSGEQSGPRWLGACVVGRPKTGERREEEEEEEGGERDCARVQALDDDPTPLLLFPFSAFYSPQAASAARSSAWACRRSPR